MNGSRLARGRAGRLALFSGAAVCALLLVYLYRSASAEIARIRDLHVKCAQQQEALAAQLQVIYEYKVRLENTLKNEKSANAAAKEELQQKASRERSLRDKDSLEAMQRLNSMQQNYKQLQAEQQDLKEDCKNKEDVALENTKRLESTLQDLRIQLKKVEQDKEKSMEHLKIKYTELISEKEQLDEKYNNLKKSVSEDTEQVQRLQKQIIQLQRELDDTKISPHFPVGGLNVENSQVQPRHANVQIVDNNNGMDKPDTLENNQMPTLRTSSKQQTSISSTSNSAKLEAAAAAAVPAPPNGGPSESSSKFSSPVKGAASVARSQAKVKLPEGVPPIPRLVEPEPAEQQQPRKEESVGQAPPVKLAPGSADSAERHRRRPEAKSEDKNEAGPGQQRGARHMGEQILERREPEVWYKLKPGIQEVGDPNRVEKNGFVHAGGNEDVEQYDEYNYKEPQNKNGDLHIEEGEDEREDEDDYMHNNMNAHILGKHE